MQCAWQPCYSSCLLQHNVSGCQLNKQGGFLDRQAFLYPLWSRSLYVMTFHKLPIQYLNDFSHQCESAIMWAIIQSQLKPVWVWPVSCFLISISHAHIWTWILSNICVTIFLSNFAFILFPILFAPYDKRCQAFFFFSVLRKQWAWRECLQMTFVLLLWWLWIKGWDSNCFIKEKCTLKVQHFPSIYLNISFSLFSVLAVTKVINHLELCWCFQGRLVIRSVLQGLLLVQ